MSIRIDSENGMIKYTSRDYSSILAEFFDLIPKLTDLWKPEADADPGVVLGKYLASIADMLGVNLDWLANEVFAPSVTQRKDAEKLFSLIGYELGWYTAARTEVIFTNAKEEDTITFNFGFNGSNFATLNAYTDITGQSRVITYNILPNTNAYGVQDTRSKRDITAGDADIFKETDECTLEPGASVTRVAIEGELRYINVKVENVKSNNYIISLPSQHIDTTAVWIKAKSSLSADAGYLGTQWRQVSSASEFNTPEPRFAVTYDSYSNAQIQVSNYLDVLENYDDNYLIVYWFECSGAIGSVGKDVLQNYLQAQSDSNQSAPESGDYTISNLSNTTEQPHTNTVTGKSPETAKEAYANSRNYINTWDSFITVPDFNRFILREPGVDTGIVIDCQKAAEINLAIYKDDNLTSKGKKYINKDDFELETGKYEKIDWAEVLDLDFDPNDPNKYIFSTNFKRYTAMCYVIYDDFNDGTVTPRSDYAFDEYILPDTAQTAIKADFAPCGAMTAELSFGRVRIFPWYVTGIIYPKNPVSEDVAKNIVSRVKEALSVYFAPANRSFGQKPTTMEVVEVIEGADSRIRYFDGGSLTKSTITWGASHMNGSIVTDYTYDIEYFNAISFARYQDLGSNLGQTDRGNIYVAPEWVLD